MKKLIPLLALLLLFSCDKNDRFADLTGQLSDPGKEYRPVPLWVWNSRMTTEDVDNMLPQFKKQGFGGAFIHARWGLETEYLSKEWFDLWKYSVEKGKELGLDMWIYDEDGCPSGFAGGYVASEMPESYNRGTNLAKKRSKLPPAKDSCLMCLLREGDAFTDITADLDSYKGIEGDYYIYNIHCPKPSAGNGGFPYVDLLAKGVTEKFIDVTMRGYEETFGDELGTVIKGTFSDEAHISPAGFGWARWTHDFFDVFQETWGYDIRPYWPLLAEEIGDWKRIRHNYNTVILRLFTERWSKPMREYTEKHGLLWTGHYWEHAWPEMSCGLDNMAMAAYHQMPGIDMLFNQFDDKSLGAQFGNARAVAELRSVANQMGCTRTLSETYGGAGQDLSFQDMKRLGDWEYALGVNFMNQHICHTTITGVNKYDYPPEFTPMSPWWEDYHILNDYFSRLSLILSHGKQLSDWIILEPTTSVWMYFTCEFNLWNRPGEIGRPFQAMVADLEKNMVEFDLGCEDMIRNHGSVTPSGFKVGQRTYSTVVIPSTMENLDRSTFELLKKFSDNGGTILAMTIPTCIDGSQSDEAKTLNVTEISSTQELIDRFNAPLDYKEAKGLYHQHRIFEDGELHFFANSSLENQMPLSFSAKEEDASIYSIDAMTGTIAKLPDASVSTTLPPAGSALYFITEDELPASAAPAEASTHSETVSCSPVKVSRTGQNALNLDFCSLTVNGKRTNDVYVKEANRLMWASFGRKDPWEFVCQFKTDVLDGDTLTHGNVCLEYQFNVSSDVNTSSMRMIVERPAIWNVSLNGQPLTAVAADTLLDRRCGLYDISPVVREGLNTVTVQRDVICVHCQAAPVIILGDFDVLGVSQGWRIAPKGTLSLGDITTQGTPEYPWTISYSKKCNLESVDGKYTVKLGKWKGTSAKVIVNGKAAGNISFPPYELDITDCLAEGENTVDVRITGTLRNLYGPHFRDVNGLVDPGYWDKVEKKAAGDEYKLSETGLIDDYTIKCTK